MKGLVIKMCRDEFSIRGRDWLGAMVEAVEFNTAEEVEGIEDGCCNQKKRH